MSVQQDCTEQCEAAPRCTVCGLTKRPRGRSVPVEMENGMCGRDCPGWNQEPTSGHLWPGEIARSKENHGDES